MFDVHAHYNFVLQLQEVAFYHEHTLIKDAGTNKKTPWHVDQTYYPINGDKVNTHNNNNTNQDRTLV